jgi:hypothetical protein
MRVRLAYRPKLHDSHRAQGLTAIAVAGMLLVDTMEYYIPRRKLEMFRKEYLAKEVVEWRKQLSPDIRINLMFAGRGKLPQKAYFLDAAARPPTFAERWLFQNEFRLWGPQFTRTCHLKGVISNPIVKASEGLSPTFTAVGVLNLDTDTVAGASCFRPTRRRWPSIF